MDETDAEDERLAMEEKRERILGNIDRLTNQVWQEEKIRKEIEEEILKEREEINKTAWEKAKARAEKTEAETERAVTNTEKTVRDKPADGLSPVDWVVQEEACQSIYSGVPKDNGSSNSSSSSSYSSSNFDNKSDSSFSDE